MGACVSSDAGAAAPPEQRSAAAPRPSGGAAASKAPASQGAAKDPKRNVRALYDFGEMLGKGGFAEVRLATEKATGKQVAMKIMTLPANPRSVDDNTREDVMKEINLLTGLDHPNIVKLYEYFDEKKKFYLSTELMRGGELLKSVIEKERYGENDAKQCFVQMLRGIQYLHENKITHRDLKLENLMLDEKGSNVVKIVDFGLAKRAQETIMDTVCGTPQYVAPEVISGDDTSVYDNKVDMWSAGVVLYVLLGGYPPFYDENEPRLFQKIANGIYDFDDDVWEVVSEDAKDLIRGLLTVNPAKRLDATQALQHKWVKTENAVNNSLLATQKNMAKTYRKRLKAAVHAVLAQERIKALMGNVAQGFERSKSIVENPDDMSKARAAADHYVEFSKAAQQE